MKELFIDLKKFIEKTNNQINMNTVFENIDDIFNTINSITILIQFNNDKIVDNTIYNNQIENIKLNLGEFFDIITNKKNPSSIEDFCINLKKKLNLILNQEICGYFLVYLTSIHLKLIKQKFSSLVQRKKLDQF